MESQNLNYDIRTYSKFKEYLKQNQIDDTIKNKDNSATNGNNTDH